MFVVTKIILVAAPANDRDFWFLSLEHFEKIAWHVSPTARNSVFIISAFLVRSASSFFSDCPDITVMVDWA